MADVTIKPMPLAYRKIPEKFRPQAPPKFDGEPTADDRALADALLAELDPESRRWYGDCIKT